MRRSAPTSTKPPPSARRRPVLGLPVGAGVAGTRLAAGKLALFADPAGPAARARRRRRRPRPVIELRRQACRSTRSAPGFRPRQAAEPHRVGRSCRGRFGAAAPPRARGQYQPGHHRRDTRCPAPGHRLRVVARQRLNQARRLLLPCRPVALTCPPCPHAATRILSSPPSPAAVAAALKLTATRRSPTSIPARRPGQRAVRRLAILPKKSALTDYSYRCPTTTSGSSWPPWTSR